MSRIKAKESVLGGLKNVYCRLRPSKIAGIGVFAVRDIPKGADPFKGCPKKRWFKLSIKELGRLDKAVRKMIADFCVTDKKDFVWISEDGLNAMDISFFLNDSPKPNLKTIDDGEHFRTLRKIRKGEEVTVAYSTYDEKYR